MDYPESEKFACEGITRALLNTLEMAMEDSETEREKYGWYNGLRFAVKAISAADAAKSVTPDGTTVAGHVDHVRVCLTYTRHHLEGEPFEDWEASWSIRSPDELEWLEIKSKLEREYLALREFIQAKPFWRDEELAAAINNVAHTAYHAGVVRQILKG